MDTLHTGESTQKLLRCKIVNKQEKTSERFIEFDHFKLWAYMMFHKHGLKIKEVSLWLWIQEKEFRQRQQIYSRAPEIAEVSRVSVFVFDQENNFSHVIHRYALKEESPAMEKILASHLSPQIVEAGNYEISVHGGFCVKNQPQNIDKMILGLSDRDERIWYRER